jgi:uncharacterized NAD(P)/FAD-binding protein YdhS
MSTLWKRPDWVAGRGVAYGAHHPLHLLNVGTRDLSARLQAELGKGNEIDQFAVRHLRHSLCNLN